MKKKKISTENSTIEYLEFHWVASRWFANCNVVGIWVSTFDNNVCLMTYPLMLRPIIILNNNDFPIFLHVIFKSLLLLFAFESHNVHISSQRRCRYFSKMDWLTLITQKSHLAFAHFTTITRELCSLFELYFAFLFVLLWSSLCYYYSNGGW